MRKLLVTVFSALALTSCEIPFELDVSPAPKLYVQCLPSNEYGQTLLRVQYSQSTSGNRNDPRFQEYFSPDSLEFTVNGRRLESTLQVSSWICDWRCRIVDCAFEPGDEIRLYVKGADAPSVRSSTVVPPIPEIKSLDYRVIPMHSDIADPSSDTSYVTFCRLALPGGVNQGEYYGLQALRRTDVIQKWRYLGDTSVRMDTTSFLQFISAGQLASPSDIATLDLDAYAQVNYKDHLIGTTPLDQPMMLLTSRLFDGETYSFYLDSFDSQNWDSLVERMDLPRNDGDSDGGTVGGTISKAEGGKEEREVLETFKAVSYKLYLYRFSDELYRYCKAQFLSYFNALSNFGLTPPNFTYTNVENGMGVLGGISVCESEWFELNPNNNR